MADTVQLAPSWLRRWELGLVVLAAAVGFCLIPISLGQIGISWDMLNHHIYLGWTAEHSRFDRDYLAASYQAYQYPYLYWPVYKLAVAGASGVTAGIVLALLHLVSVPPVWLLARVCIPGEQWFDVGMRAVAVLLAFTSSVVLSLFDSTSSDLMAAAPLVWALGLAFLPMGPKQLWLTVNRAIALSGFFAGVSVAFKLSNAPLAILLPLVWLLYAGTLGQRVQRLVWGGFATVTGYMLAYGYWGWQLWGHFGNPIYPFYDSWFTPVRELLGWAK
jgi:hypothetical protein